MSKQTIKTLYAEADRSKLDPILAALKAKGIQVSDQNAEGEGTLLAAFGENFYTNESLKKALLDAVARNEHILLLQVDECEIPDKIKNAVYARNIITVGDRSPELVADRIIDALPSQKSRSPIVFAVGGVVVLALVAVLALQGVRGKKETAQEPVAGQEQEQEQEIAYPLPAGLTETELAEIRCVVVMGDHFKYYTNETRLIGPEGGIKWPDMLQVLANEYGDDFGGRRQWFWKEDGNEITRASYDLRFLSLMPNLEELHLAEVEVTQAPDLSALARLSRVCAMECDLGDISWIANSRVSEVKLRGDTDYSPLGSLAMLKNAELTVTGDKPLDFSYFSPQALKQIRLTVSGGAGYADLSGLAKCPDLKEVMLQNVPIRDLSFLQGRSGLEVLEMNSMDQMEDISAVESLKGLKRLTIGGCRNVRDYDPISGCINLISVRIDPGERQNMQDASFLAGLSKLERIDLSGVELPDLDFLSRIAESRSYLDSFHFSGYAGDLSGLAAFEKIAYVSLDLENRVSFEQIAPYLEGVKSVELELSRLGAVDLSTVPAPIETLILNRCELTDLTSMPQDWPTPNLVLRNCALLRSLEGLESQSSIGNNGGNLTVYNCFRLTDWDAVAGMKLNHLEITGGYTLPSFANLRSSELCLDSVADVKDLTFLDEMDNSETCSFKLVGLEEVNNLKPLERFRGRYIAVSPELAEQGQDLVSSGHFTECRIEYPDRGWEFDESGITLLSLDELETLPDALLRRVGILYLVGDTVVDSSRYDVWVNAHPDGNVEVELFDFTADEESTMDFGEGVVTDLGALEKLTGLRELGLFVQPLESLDGIQNFGELEVLRVTGCRSLTDVSPAFTLQGLHILGFGGCPVESIQGVQNLPELWELRLEDTNVTDLMPLAECSFDGDFGPDGGFRLNLTNAPIEDYSPLASIPVYKELQVSGVNAAVLVPILSEVKIYDLSAIECFTANGEGDAEALFADFAERHPELNRLSIPWNDGITDLTLLLEMDNLESVRVSGDMTGAIESLSGMDLPFELVIED